MTDNSTRVKIELFEIYLIKRKENQTRKAKKRKKVRKKVRKKGRKKRTGKKERGKDEKEKKV